MSCAINPILMAHQWRNGSAPLLIGALREKQWRKLRAISFPPTAHQWRNGSTKTQP